MNLVICWLGERMTFLDKIERKFGRFAIKNLTIIIISTYVMGLLMMSFAPNTISLFLLEPRLILQGQVWRLVTWLFVPPVTFDIWLIVTMFFYYMIGKQLERKWGAFRYNIYVFRGVLFTIVSAFIVYAISGYGLFIASGGWFNTYYILQSLFFAYVVNYSEEYVLLYFIIPIKMKWFAIFTALMMIRSLVISNWFIRAQIIASLLSFMIYFIYNKKYNNLFNSKGLSARAYIKPAKVKPVASPTGNNAPKHKCATCGKTEADGDNLEFRYCSKCEGDYEYCQEHLFTHEHIKRTGDD